MIFFYDFLFFVSWARGGQAKICGAYADLVGTKMYGLQIFSMGLQIFSIMYFNQKPSFSISVSYISYLTVNQKYPKMA